MHAWMGGAGLGAVALVLATGCEPQRSVLGPTGYEQNVFEYKVSYEVPTQRLFLPPDWQLDNYYREYGDNWAPKEGPDYVATRELDANGDGQIAASEKSKEPIYDLRFVNRRDSGVIWIKAHPLAANEADRDLDVILRDYADGLSGTGLYAQSNLFSVEHARTRQFTSFITEKDIARIGPLKGISGLIELGEVSRLQLDPNSRTSKVKIAFFKFIQFASVGSLTAAGAAAYSKQMDCPLVKRADHDGYWCGHKALLVVGYYNAMPNFGSHVAEFDRLFSQISLLPDTIPPQ